jgi:hypothetical protein
MDNVRGFKKQALKTSLHDWLLISACVMVFLILPLLFAWNSMSMIHNRVYGPVFDFSDEPIVKHGQAPAKDY